MDLRKTRKQTGLTIKQLSQHLSIPYKTFQYWELEKRTCPEYLKRMIEEYLGKEKINSSNLPPLPLSSSFSSFKELRIKTGKTKKWFSEYFDIPYRTIQNWESETKEGRKCARYLLALMEKKIKREKLL